METRDVVTYYIIVDGSGKMTRKMIRIRLNPIKIAGQFEALERSVSGLSK